MHRARFSWLLLPCLLLYGHAPSRHARADELVLHTGGRLVGEIEEVEGGYVVRRNSMSTFVRRGEVAEIRETVPLAKQYAARVAELDAEDPNAHVALGDWCAQAGMPQEARWHFMMAVALAPEHAGARRRAGFLRERGEWVTREESMQARGMVRFRGRWVPAAEAASVRAEEARRREREETGQEVWSFFYSIIREPENRPLAPAVDTIAEWGLRAEPFLHRGAHDANARLREATALALGRMSTQATRDLLLARHRRERDPRLLTVLAHASAERPDRLETMRALGQFALSSHDETLRENVWRSLKAMRDPRVIEMLIPVSGVNTGAPDTRTPSASGSAARGTGGEERGGGPETLSGSTDEPQKPCYPAAEGLQYITGMRIPPNVEQWTLWWEGVRDTYEMPVLEPLRPREDMHGSTKRTR